MPACGRGCDCQPDTGGWLAPAHALVRCDWMLRMTADKDIEVDMIQLKLSAGLLQACMRQHPDICNICSPSLGRPACPHVT